MRISLSFKKHLKKILQSKITNRTALIFWIKVCFRDYGWLNQRIYFEEKRILQVTKFAKHKFMKNGNNQEKTKSTHCRVFNTLC